MIQKLYLTLLGESTPTFRESWYTCSVLSIQQAVSILPPYICGDRQFLSKRKNAPKYEGYDFDQYPQVNHRPNKDLGWR